MSSYNFNFVEDCPCNIHFRHMSQAIGGIYMFIFLCPLYNKFLWHSTEKWWKLLAEKLPTSRITHGYGIYCITF